MSDMMTFPDTWEEFEKSYGFTDNEEVYTNGARLIPSFRVKQWLDQLPSVQPTTLTEDDKETIRIHLSAFKERLCNQRRWNEAKEYEELISRLLSTPSVQPRKGKWIYGEHESTMCDGYRCNKCGFFVPWDYQHKFIDFIKDYNYCPSCGADMRGSEQG